MAGWMAYDVDDHEAARRLWTYALDTARRAEDHPRARRAHDELRHPMYFVSSPTVNALTVFLDDPHIGWAAGRLNAAGELQRAGIDFDQVPMALLKTPASVTIDPDNPAKDHQVENIIDRSMHRIGPHDPGPMNALPGWDMTYDQGKLQLH